MIAILLTAFCMTVKNLLKSKRFWTLVSAIVAAFAAFFLSTGCSRATLKFKGDGEVEYFYKGVNGPSLKSE